MQSSSLFNSATFMETVYRGVELDTTFTPVPDGEYLAKLRKIDFRVVQNERVNPPYGVGLGFEGQWQLLDDEFDLCKAAAAIVGIPNPTVRQGFLMDIVDPSKILINQAALDTGKNKNIRLGILLQAAGFNKKAGWRINQLLEMVGGIRVGQGRPNADGDTFPEVKAVISVVDWTGRQKQRTTALRANGPATGTPANPVSPPTNAPGHSA